MEVCMDDSVLFSQRINVAPAERDMEVPGIRRKVYLKEGEFLIVPDFILERRVKGIDNINSYIVFDDIVVIKSLIQFKANLVAEVVFIDENLDEYKLCGNIDINRFKIPFEGSMRCGLPGIRKIDITGEAQNRPYKLIYHEDDERLRDFKGFAILQTSFDVDVYIKLQ